MKLKYILSIACLAVSMNTQAFITSVSTSGAAMNAATMNMIVTASTVAIDDMPKKTEPLRTLESLQIKTKFILPSKSKSKDYCSRMTYVYKHRNPIPCQTNP